MSTHAPWRVRLVLALAIGVSTGGFALAAGSLQSLSNPSLAPSAVPALLGPITEAGRKGWECFPERAAMAKAADSAELPSETAAH